MPDPQLPHGDWVLTRPRLTGICGSDSKQILMDFGEGDADNAMSAFCSFPQVMGHEVVADVVALGPEGAGLRVGQRVVLNPWLSCGPRGIAPPCPACQAGDYSLCWSFADGDLSAGIHAGVSADVTGGYAELMPAHDSMLFAVPDSIPDEVAVFADPFSVSLHAVTATPARYGRGAGVRGRLAGVVRGRHPAGAVSRRGRGRGGPFRCPGRAGPPVRRRESPCPRAAFDLIEELVAWGGGRLRRPLLGLPMAHPARSTSSTTRSESPRPSRWASGSCARGAPW